MRGLVNTLILKLALRFLVVFTKFMLFFLPRWAGMSKREFEEKLANTDVDALAEQIANDVRRIHREEFGRSEPGVKIDMKAFLDKKRRRTMERTENYTVKEEKDEQGRVWRTRDRG